MPRPSPRSRTRTRSPEDPESEEDSDEDSWRRAIPWGKVLLASLAITVVALAGITVVEAITGKPISSVTGGSDSQGTTVGNVTGRDKSQQDTDPSDKSTPGSDEQKENEQAPDEDSGQQDSEQQDNEQEDPEPSAPATPEPSDGQSVVPEGAPAPLARAGQPASASLIASTNAGRSPGLRLVIRLPSTTTSSSTQFAPAFFRSSATLW